MYVYVCTYVFVVYEHNTARNISNITATIKYNSNDSFVLTLLSVEDMVVSLVESGELGDS